MVHGGTMVPPWYHHGTMISKKINILAPELLTLNFHVFAMLLVTIRTAMPPKKIFRQVSDAEFQYKSVQRHH